jgi:hypothetical protein
VSHQRQPTAQDLHSEIKNVCDMMLRVHYNEPANWLWIAVSAPQSCRSAGARAALTEARTIATQFGFPRVARWVSTVIEADAIVDRARS